MRNDWRARAVVLLGFVLAAAGCSTTQPDSLGKRTASVQILTKADVSLFNCYELWAPGSDGNPEFQQVIECYAAINSTGNQEVANRSIPWHYSVSISIIHAGSINEEIVTSLSGVIGSSIQPGDGIDDFISMTEYDPTDQPASVGKADENRGGVIFSFLNGKLVSRGSPIWLSPNFFELGDPNILDPLSASPTFDFEVNSGDTVIVRARKQTVAASAHFLQVAPSPNITLSGTLSIGGALITPAGTTSSTTADAAGISFSFTVQ